jgi:hypothetical protein
VRKHERSSLNIQLNQPNPEFSPGQLSKPQNKEARWELEEAFYETVCRAVTDNRSGKIDKVRIAVIL